MLKNRLFEMDNLNKYKAQLKEIEALIEKLENGTLEINELIQLEELTRSIHERSVILKYKIFEEESVSTPSSNEENEEPTVAEEEPEVLEKQEEIEEIDFSMFETPQEVESQVEQEAEEEVEENDTFQPEAEDELEPEEELELEEEPESEEEPELEDPVLSQNETNETVDKVFETEVTNDDELEFWQKINVQDDSLSSQFAESKLDSLIGAFSLNEKLRYINDLFDGSSEMFSDAVKALDKLSDLDAAHVQFGEFADEHNWDPEDEAVVEFMSFVRRRYA